MPAMEIGSSDYGGRGSSRREFLRGAVATGASLAAAGGVMSERPAAAQINHLQGQRSIG